MRTDDLLVLKSRNASEQRIAIDDFTREILAKGESGLTALRAIADDGVVHVETEAPEQLIRYCLFALYAADIGTVPSKESRDRHVAHMADLAAEYGLTLPNILHLARFATRIERAINGLDRATLWQDEAPT
jgi:hypothetical protein